ncbi:MAG: hypothetical protein U0V70_12610 [Terriglobia bacterium]
MGRNHLQILPSPSTNSVLLALLTLWIWPWASLAQGKVHNSSDNLEPFHCSWKILRSRGNYPSSSVELDETGNAQIQWQKLDSELLRTNFRLRRSSVVFLYSLFSKSDFFDAKKNFVSDKKIADLGMKTISFQKGSERREVSFNFTEDKALQEINIFFENLAEQERFLLEMELTLKYDRLGITKKLDMLERELSANRIVAPERFKPILEQISNDNSLINLARKEALKLLARLAKMEPEGS